jgi:hypothetical protein
MKRKRYCYPTRKRGKEARDLWSLVNWRDLSYRAGQWLYNKSWKYTAIVAMASAGSFIGKTLGSYIGVDWFRNYTAEQAIAAPLFFGASMFVFGVSLMALPILITSRRHLTAHANDLNLMEDYKKSLADPHLDVLWEQVFRYESDLLYTDAQREAERREIQQRRAEYLRLEQAFKAGVRDPEARVDDILALRPWSDQIEKTREAFFISSRYILRHSLSQMAEAANAGFSLSLLEDWYDDHPFPEGDAKLVEQYYANTLLTQSIAEVGYTRNEWTRIVIKMNVQRWWASLIGRAVTTNIGTFIPYLNKKYATNVFNSQILLWPGEENRPEIARFAEPANSAARISHDLLFGYNRRTKRRLRIVEPSHGAREEIVRLRRNLFRNVFGETLEDAFEMIDRICLTSFELATDLRRRFDAEYAAGELRETVATDLAAEAFSDRYVRSRERLAALARRRIDAFVEALRAGGRFAALFEFGEREALRAVKTAFHVNRSGLRSKFERAGLAACEPEIEAARAEARAYSIRLRQLRIHHTITKLELQLYRDLVKSLGGY